MDNIDVSEIGSFAGYLLPIIGWFLTKLYGKFEALENKTEDLEDALAEHRVQDASIYLHKSEVDKVLKYIHSSNAAIQVKLQSIEEHLRLHYDRRNSN